MKIVSEQIGCRIKYEFYKDTNSNIERLVTDILKCIESKPLLKKNFNKTDKIIPSNKIDIDNEFVFPSL